MDYTAVIPSSSPVVTPIKLYKKRKLQDLDEIEPPFSAYPESPESIHSSDPCSYSSYFERKQEEREETHYSHENLTKSTYQSVPSSYQPKVDSSQQELEDIALPVKNHQVPELDDANITIQTENEDDSDDESPGMDTLTYIRKYCTESILHSLPDPEMSSQRGI